MSNLQTPSTSLPSEPLLEIRTSAIARCRAMSLAVRWLRELEGIGNLQDRSRALSQQIRKRMTTGQLDALLEALLSQAAEGESPGVAGLAALVAVRAPGHSVVESVHEFRHLHRVTTRCHHRLQMQEKLRPEETKLLEQLESLQPGMQSWIAAEVDANALPSPVDLGPAGQPRKAFDALAIRLDREGSLEPEALDLFLKLARLEQRAAEIRTSRVAETLDPLSGKAVHELLPRISQLDVEIRELSNFLDAMERERELRLFHEQVPVLHEALEPAEYDLLRAFCQDHPSLASGAVLLDGVRERPLSMRIVAYYADRLMEIGNQLFERELRPVPIDLVEALLLIQGYANERELRVPLGPLMGEALKDARVRGLELHAGEMVIAFEAAAARRVRAPLGLPQGLSAEEEETGDEQSIKELVMGNINNTSVLLGLLKNPKVYNTPGVVAQVAQGCRTLRVLEVICTTKTLHAGYANKDVPLHLVRSPSRIPVKLLRRLIHVKYISKVELRRLSHDKTGLRREVFDEVRDYLSTLA